MLKVAVIGAYGKLGSQSCLAIEATSDLSLVARIGSKDSLQAVVDAGADVALDVTRPDAVLANVSFCVSAGVPVVVGTSGVNESQRSEIADLLAAAPRIGVIVAPNFSLGAVLMMTFAAQAARHFESVEVVELHHARKVDAPSGTASRTAELLGAARAEAGLAPVPDATEKSLDGARGAVVSGVHVHSVRLPGLVAHQEVLFGGTGETLTLRHDSMSYSSFDAGILLALRAVVDKPGLTVGLEHLLFNA
ncbi:4-hydroxy-tetrahydrodipicolinate reductase [Tenggerimyces flavus]|uniref:4-hydroxy-tetrahydrodipicolinate reductase n=1 Tax=Tenggerimyces flavus TaxID=1708749 RepID=A0ABV7YB81_9ACTN|nr:4-hydroxy-tetrahydrodipicolinate reductase [Tenggerimyces flavus]MBM7786900.1 4-hydroxy-tetrahydrodipicolinate reductase [Tenggerimyces flavus]